MGMPAVNFEAYAETANTEEKIYDRPEVKESADGSIDFGDEDSTVEEK